MKFLFGRWLTVAAAIVMSVFAAMPARADVVVQIDKSSQRMAVSVDGSPRYNWPVSTGRAGTDAERRVPSAVDVAALFSRKYYSRDALRDLLLITVSPFTAPTTSPGSAARPRMAVRLHPRMQRRCSRWSSATPAQYADRDQLGSD